MEKPKKLHIDFLYLDLDTCARCKGTDARLEAALAEASGALREAGVEISVIKTRVTSEAQARALGFVSSPTLRVNGADVALELRESRCESCEAVAGGAPVDCRVWIYQGREYTEAPAPMIVEAILRHAGGAAASQFVPPLAEAPENLKRYFAAQETGPRNCCSSERRSGCCGPLEKETCCGPKNETCACG